MISKNFIQKVLVLTACSFGLMNAGFASDLTEDQTGTKNLATPNTAKPQSSGNETTVDVSPGGIAINKTTINSEDGKGNATVQDDVRGTPVFKTTVNKNNPV